MLLADMSGKPHKVTAKPPLHASVVSRRRAFEVCLLLMLGGYLFIDTLNGLFVKTLGLPNVLSAGYKQLFLLLVLVFAFQFEPRRFLMGAGILVAVCIWSILRFVLVDDVQAFYAFQEAIKVSYLFVLLTVLTKITLLDERVLRWILLFATLVVLLNVSSTFIGLGQTTYEDFGAKGFFYSGNAVSGVIVICATYFLVKNYQKSKLLFLTTIVLFALLTLVIGTKSGFLGIVVAASLVMLVYMDARTLLLIGAVIMLTATGVYLMWEVIQANPLYHRIVFFYKSGGLEMVIFSGRDIKLDAVWPVLTSGNLTQFLLGADINAMMRTGVTRVEFDWIDMQINFGIVLSAAVYLGYLWIFFYLMTLRKTPQVVAAIISFVVLMMISSIAGHVMYNGMVTPLWAVIIAGALNSAHNYGVKRVPHN